MIHPGLRLARAIYLAVAVLVALVAGVGALQGRLDLEGALFFALLVPGALVLWAALFVSRGAGGA